MNSKTKFISILLIICFISPAYSLNVDLEAAGGDRINNPQSSIGLAFIPGSGTSADPRLIGSNSTPHSINKIQWRNFNIDSGEFVKFIFNESEQTILNYIPFNDGVNYSHIQGNVLTEGNGRLMIVNPNGIFCDGANFSNTLNASNLFFSNMPIDYDVLDEGASLIEFGQAYLPGGSFLPDDVLSTGIDIHDTTIQNIDKVWLYGNGIRITENSLVSAVSDVNIFAVGSSDYNVYTDNISYNCNVIPSIYVRYLTNPQFSNSYAHILLDETSTIRATNGNVELSTFALQWPLVWATSVDIQGTIEANAAVETSGEVYIQNYEFYDYASFFNLTGTIRVNDNDEVFPKVDFTGMEVRSREYNITAYDPYSTPDLPDAPTFEYSETGTVRTNSFNKLGIYFNPNAGQSYTTENVGVNKDIIRFSIDEVPLEDTLTYIYGPQPSPPPPPPSPPPISDGGSNAAAIAIPLGIAGAGLLSLAALPGPIGAAAPVCQMMSTMRAIPTYAMSAPRYFAGRFAPAQTGAAAPMAAPSTGLSPSGSPYTVTPIQPLQPGYASPAADIPEKDEENK